MPRPFGRRFQELRDPKKWNRRGSSNPGDSYRERYAYD